MEQYVIRLTNPEAWTHLGTWEGNAKVPEAEVIVRPYDADILFAVGSSSSAPEGDPVTVAKGEGARLVGTNFFIRLASSASTRVYHRGLIE